MANFELLPFANADELARAAATAWLDEVESARRAGTPHCVALSGGRITRKFFAASAEMAITGRISLGHVHFFWADERCVPPGDPESNFKLAADLLFAPLQIPAGQIHRIHGEDSPVAAAGLAGEELRRFTPEKCGEPALDLVFLGMGEDGHVASLFPAAPEAVANGVEPFLAVANSPKPPPVRISLSYAALTAATCVWALVSGDGKAAALKESLRAGGRTPLGRVIRSRSRTKIFCDVPLD